MSLDKVAAELARVIDAAVKERRVPREAIIGALEAAMESAARKKLGLQRDIEAHFNEELFEVELFQFRQVVNNVTNVEREISMEDARLVDPDAVEGDVLGEKLDSSSLGRISAHHAKQVIVQRVRDAEKENIFNEYKDRKSEIVNGLVRRFERGNIIVDLGRAEAILPIKEQIPRESYNVGDRVRGYITDVHRSSNTPQIVMSRSTPEFLRKLFEMEVPEIYEGIVKIVAAAREPGSRAKIAVTSSDVNVDPVGACVGMRGSRVQGVVTELRGEKIDIINYSDNPAKFVCNALAPAEISKVIIDEDLHSMDIIVADDQLSLAIGKKGQNVRLAVMLTGWKIDIHSETKFKDIEEQAKLAFGEIPELTSTLKDLLIKTGFNTLDDLADATVGDLMEFPGVDEDTALAIMEKAYELTQTGAYPKLEDIREKQRKEAEEQAAVVAQAKADEAAAQAEADAAAAPAAEEQGPSETPSEGGGEGDEK